jgi:hypothetical protein
VILTWWYSRVLFGTFSASYWNLTLQNSKELYYEKVLHLMKKCNTLFSNLGTPLWRGVFKQRRICVPRKGLINWSLVMIKELRWVYVKSSASSNITSPWILNCAASYKLRIPCTSLESFSLKFFLLLLNFSNISVDQFHQQN